MKTGCPRIGVCFPSVERMSGRETLVDEVAGMVEHHCQTFALQIRSLFGSEMEARPE
jgi:hypothetical protein